MHLPSYLSISYFCVGSPREGFSEACWEGAALLQGKLAGSMKGPAISYQLGVSIQLRGQWHLPTRAPWLHFSSSTPKSLPETEGALELQTVGSSTQRAYGPYETPKCCWLEQHGLRKASDHQITFCTRMHTHMELQLLF